MMKRKALLLPLCLPPALLTLASPAGAEWFHSKLNPCQRKTGRMVQLFPPGAPPDGEGPGGFRHRRLNPGRDPALTAAATPYAVATASSAARLTLRGVTIDLDADFKDGTFNQNQKQWEYKRAGNRSNGRAGQYEYKEVSSRTDVAAYVNGAEIARFGYASSSTNDRRRRVIEFPAPLVYSGEITLGARSWGTGVDPESSVWLHGEVETVMPDPAGELFTEREVWSEGSRPLIRWEVLK